MFMHTHSSLYCSYCSLVSMEIEFKNQINLEITKKDATREVRKYSHIDLTKDVPARADADAVIHMRLFRFIEENCIHF